MVLSRARTFESGFPSRVISIVVEKFSPGKDTKNSSSEGKRVRGRRMVAEELKLSRVDVKERQQQFENMARAKESKIRHTNRSQSAENPTKRLITPSRNTRSVSAEPTLRSNIFKQNDKNRTTFNGSSRTGSVKKQNDFTVYKNSINVGKVADKFEKKSELKQDAAQCKTRLLPVNESDRSKGLDKKRDDIDVIPSGKVGLSKSPRSSFSPIVEDRIRKLERGEIKTSSGNGISGLQIPGHDRSVMLSEIPIQKYGCQINNTLEPQNNGMEEITKDISPVKRDVGIDTASNRNFFPDHEEELRENNEEKTSVEEDLIGRTETEEKVAFMTQDNKKVDEDDDKENYTQTGSEIVPANDAAIKPTEQNWTRNDETSSAPVVNGEPSISGQLSKKNTSSVKIVISNRTPKSPSNQRRTAIVRVNSRSSDKPDIRAQAHSTTSKSLSGLTVENEDVNSESARISLETPKECADVYENDSIDYEIQNHRSESSSSVFEDESGYYRNVRSDFKGQSGLSPEKQHLLSRLISLENKGLAKSLGFSDELLELLREEEGFWKRQVELKKWRETHESKGKDHFEKKTFDPAKEKKIAELRRQHNLRQTHKPREEDGLTVEELLLAEERLLTQEASSEVRLGKEEEERRIPFPLVNYSPKIGPINKTIHLQQRPVSSGVDRLNNILPNRDIRYSYPPTLVAGPSFRDGSIGSLKAKSNVKSYEHLPRNPQSITSENTRSPSLNTVSNGPITYFEHIANVQRKSLVAEPYASHPRRKSIESPKSLELPTARSNGDLKFGSHDSVFDYSKVILQGNRDAEGVDTDSRVANRNYDTDLKSPFIVVTGGSNAFDFSKGSSPTEEGNVFKHLQQQSNFTDPSYLSLIDNKMRDQDHFSKISQQVRQSHLTNSNDAVNESKTSIDIDRNVEVNTNYQPQSEEDVNNNMRTYHVTSVAVRYAKAGPSSEGILAKNEAISQSSNSIEGPISRPMVNGSRAFSETDSMFNGNRSEFRSLSDEALGMERLREAKLIVAKNTSKMRCSSCQRLINERALMTVAGSGMFWHTTCFYCVVCGIMLVKTKRGSATQVRLIADELHCITCFSQDGGQLSEV